MATEDVYCTLVMSDTYLPGAAVLSHSLRDAGTKKKLACLVVVEALKSTTLNELKALYDYVLPIERIHTPDPGKLYLMGRPDLVFTFSKIQLWRQTQFRRIVYLDADVLAVRAPDELFDIELPNCGFAAAPDVGWPDIFNTGVMVLTPNMGEYNALRTQASSGDSFDGADQGLFNQAFEHRGWKRLSFKYNVTPSASYQYEPAYRYFKRDISMVHFIGEHKPWQRARDQGGSGAYKELIGRWWSVYDRHFGVSTHEYADTGVRFHLTAPTMNPVESEVKRREPPSEPLSSKGYPMDYQPDQQSSASHQPDSRAPDEGEAITTEAPFTDPSERGEAIHHGLIEPTPTVQVRRFSAPHMEWDATRSAPPAKARPEAANFPTETYEFTTDATPFRPPGHYPEPPRDMWYEVPKDKPRTEDKPKPIFPWEERERPKPTRRFIEDEAPPQPPREESPPALSFGGDELEVSTDQGASTPTIQINDETHFQPFTSTKNAWDDVSGIDDYVRALTAFQRNRGNVQVIQPPPPENTPAAHTATDQSILSPKNEPDPDELEATIAKRRESLILTDFPSATERPSLPVTPAPRRRTSFWGSERDYQGNLPAAEGVPDQADWNPTEQLEQLRRSSLVAADLKLPSKKSIPDRKMPGTAASIPEEVLGHAVPKAREDDEEAGATATDVVPAAASEMNAAKAMPTFSDPGFTTASTTAAAEEARETVLSPAEKIEEVAS